jgi:periplasmic protein TonB
MTTAMSYGYKELQMTYNRTMGRAMMISLLLMLSLIGTYHLAMFLQPDDIIPIHHGTITISEWNALPLPPPIGGTQNLTVNAASIKSAYGTPVPVPDGSIDPEQTLASIKELDAPQPISGTIGDGTGDNTVLVIPPEADPEPGKFIPFEDEPVALLNPSPSYPELALRANIEGTVWVKMLVTKDGSVKKAIVEKSNADIFNESALAAANRWTFRPALMNHRPVAVWVSIPFRFRLK